ncbi:MAG: hypothetical protein J7J51_03485 [Candidatus Omnitrophica bacterium]|nr:hypothetical protein [Candidatus Omnitrophota bacterium]
MRSPSGHGSAEGRERGRAPVPCIGDREVADRYLSSNRLAGAIDCGIPYKGDREVARILYLLCATNPTLRINF